VVDLGLDLSLPLDHPAQCEVVHLESCVSCNRGKVPPNAWPFSSYTEGCNAARYVPVMTSEGLQNIDLVLAYNREALAHTKRVKEPPEEAEEVFAQNSGLRRQLKQSLEETESANKACARARDALCEMEAQVQALEESLKDARGELGLAREQREHSLAELRAATSDALLQTETHKRVEGELMHEVQLTKLEAAYALKERDHAASAQESGAKELAKLVQEHASWREVLCEREEGKMQIEADLQRLREQQESFVTKCARLEAECDTAQAERLDYNNSARVHMGIQEALEAEVRQSQQDCFEMESQLEKSRRREAEVTAQCKALAQQLERCKQQMASSEEQQAHLNARWQLAEQQWIEHEVTQNRVAADAQCLEAETVKSLRAEMEVDKTMVEKLQLQYAAAEDRKAYIECERDQVQRLLSEERTQMDEAMRILTDDLTKVVNNEKQLEADYQARVTELESMSQGLQLMKDERDASVQELDVVRAQFAEYREKDMTTKLKLETKVAQLSTQLSASLERSSQACNKLQQFREDLARNDATNAEDQKLSMWKLEMERSYQWRLDEFKQAVVPITLQ